MFLNMLLTAGARTSRTSEQFPEQRPVVVLQPSLRNSLELEEQLVPGHFPLPQRARRKWMRHGENDKLVNAIRMSRSREPCHGGSPVVANDVHCVDTERVKNADHIAERSPSAVYTRQV